MKRAQRIDYRESDAEAQKEPAADKQQKKRKVTKPVLSPQMKAAAEAERRERRLNVRYFKQLRNHEEMLERAGARRPGSYREGSYLGWLPTQLIVPRLALFVLHAEGAPEGMLPFLRYLWCLEGDAQARRQCTLICLGLERRWHLADPTVKSPDAVVRQVVGALGFLARFERGRRCVSCGRRRFEYRAPELLIDGWVDSHRRPSPDECAGSCDTLTFVMDAEVALLVCLQRRPTCVEERAPEPVRRFLDTMGGAVPAWELVRAAAAFVRDVAWRFEPEIDLPIPCGRWTLDGTRDMAATVLQHDVRPDRSWATNLDAFFVDIYGLAPPPVPRVLEMPEEWKRAQRYIVREPWTWD